MNLPLWIEHRLAECRYALRMIRKTPGVSSVAILSLALDRPGQPHPRAPRHEGRSHDSLALRVE
jgi:hypothetical protein